MTYFTIGLGILLTVFVALMAYSSHRGSGGIVLPEVQEDGNGVEGPGGESSLNVVAISPETVQAAIRTLNRPVFYSRSQTVETYWSGGRGQSVSQVYASGGQTRIDTQLADGSVRHTLVSGESGAVWYDNERVWTPLRTAGQPLASDLAGRMLTYESVLELPVEEIAAADYRELDGVYCIYTEVMPDSEGYASRYWVSVVDGLLYAAERTQNGEMVYRFTAGQLDTEMPEEELFLLPDGSALEG